MCTIYNMSMQLWLKVASVLLHLFLQLLLCFSTCLSNCPIPHKQCPCTLTATLRWQKLVMRRMIR